MNKPVVPPEYEVVEFRSPKADELIYDENSKTVYVAGNDYPKESEFWILKDLEPVQKKKKENKKTHG